jgi:hypothetical protein
VPAVDSGPAGGREQAQHLALFSTQDAVALEPGEQRFATLLAQPADEVLGGAFLLLDDPEGLDEHRLTRLCRAGQVHLGAGPHPLALDHLDVTAEGKLDEQPATDADVEIRGVRQLSGLVLDQQEQQVLRDQPCHGRRLGAHQAAARPKRCEPRGEHASTRPRIAE